MDYSQAYKNSAETSQILGKNAPEVMSKFQEVATEVLKEKSLDVKTKELIAVGIAISSRCEDCIMAHVKNAIGVGATIEELSETVEVAILMGGGPSAAYGSKVLSIAEYLFSQK